MSLTAFHYALSKELDLFQMQTGGLELSDETISVLEAYRDQSAWLALIQQIGAVDFDYRELLCWILSQKSCDASLAIAIFSMCRGPEFCGPESKVSFTKNWEQTVLLKLCERDELDPFRSFGYADLPDLDRKAILESARENAELACAEDPPAISIPTSLLQTEPGHRVFTEYMADETGLWMFESEFVQKVQIMMKRERDR